MLKYVNSKKRKRISQLATLVAIIVMIPAVLTFLKVLQESKYQRDYRDYIANEIEPNSNLWLQREVMDVENKKISLFFNGDVAEATFSDLQNELKDYENIQDFELVINANKTRNADRLLESLDRAYEDLDRKDNVIAGLQNQIEGLQMNITNLNKQVESKNQNNIISFTNLSRDAKVRYNDLEYFGYSKMLVSKDFINIDTVEVASLRWKKTLADSIVSRKERELGNWLKKELKADTIVIRRD